MGLFHAFVGMLAFFMFSSVCCKQVSSAPHTDPSLQTFAVYVPAGTPSSGVSLPEGLTEGVMRFNGTIGRSRPQNRVALRHRGSVQSCICS